MDGSKQRSFRHQLALVVTLTSAVAVGLAGTMVLWIEARGAYGEIQQEFLPLAQIIGSNSVGALSFDDPGTARETLAALAIKRSVVSARLYTAQGRPFATYRRKGSESDSLPDAPGRLGHRFEAYHLVLFQDVMHDGERVGTLYMKVATREKVGELARSAGTLVVAFVAATSVALMFSTRLQRRVSQPVTELASAARAAADRRDYTVRVEPNGPIEIRELTAGFNEMLAQIQARDAALRAARDELELRVEERVRDLRRESLERQKVEANNRLLSQAIASSREMISLSDLDNRFIFANAAFVDGYGYALDELLGKTAALFDSPSNPARLRETIEEATRLGGWRGELMNRRKDGSEIPIALSTSAVRGENGELLGYLGVARDVSEARRGEERLRLQSAALESTADAVAITDRDGLVLWVNPSFSSMTGYAEEEAIGLPVTTFRSGDSEDGTTFKEMAKTVLDGRVWDGELTNKRKDARLVPAAVTVTPVRDQAGAISHFVTVMRDVSQRRRLEEQLRQSQKMEAVGRLSGGVAHDFNNILGVIIGFGDMLLKQLPRDEKMRRYGHEILKAANRGAGLTRQLLAFSRQQVLQPKVLDLNSVVSDLEKMLARLIGEDIEMVTSLDPALGRTKVDPGQIEQVLMNLVVNARDAMPNGGTLAIETTNTDVTEAEGKKHGHPVEPGPYVKLTVTDTGCGIDAATEKHIFEPFFTTKEVGKGTGLGLATVYGIVKQSSGYVWMKSEVGVGTSFTILLPRLAAQPGNEAAAAAGGADPRGHETILVVEDDDAARELWVEMLESLGYRVLHAANGLQALETARTEAGKLDLLLSDVVMPRLGGRELAERLQSQHPGLRVMFMSGYTADAVLRQGISDTGGSFLQKPFTAQQLARKIREVLDA